MKKYVVPVLLILLIVMQAVSYATITRLQDSILDLDRRLSQTASDQSRIMESIYGNIDTQLKRQASIIDTYGYSFGEADRERLTVPMTVKVTPKVATPGTIATLYLTGKSAAMTRNGTTFEATLPLGIFDVLEAKVVFAEEGTERTEKLEIWENLREKFVPYLYVHFEGESGYRQTAGKSTVDYIRNGNLNLEIKEAVRSEFQEIRVVMEVDGNAVSDKPVENIRGRVVRIDEKVTLAPGQTMSMRLVAVDSLGLVHRLTLEEVTISEDAQPVFGEEWGMPGEAVIMDKDGHILYEPRNDGYR